MTIARALALAPFFVAAACGSSSTSSGGGSLQLTASGEVLALGGYAYPPATPDDPAFVDGWDIAFKKLLVTIDKISLSQNPDTAAADQSLVGKQVAEVTGPWAIDLHKGGPITGKGGTDEQALAITTLASQNLTGGDGFDETQRYAFGFDLVAGTTSAKRLNVTDNDADYAEMIAKGYAVMYIGTATWKGGSTCTSSDDSFDFAKLPTKVSFRLGFPSPTTYVNCQNPDNDPAKPLGSEEHQRGVQIKNNAITLAQATVHTDHPFWESFTHDSPLHFDQLAALAKQDASGHYVVTREDTVGVNYTAFTFAGAKLPWRTCLTGYTPPDTNAQMGFDSRSVPYNPKGDPVTSVRDYADYLAYNQSTQGHLNSDGLCYVSRHYTSPR